MSVKNLDDRINTDAAKNIKGSRAEETLLGLMLIFDEFRSDAASGRAGVSSDDFVTSFGKKVFDAVCRLELDEHGFSKSLLGLEFSADELGRIERIELERRSLARNDREVFLASIAALKKEKATVNSDSDPFADLKLKQQMNKKAKENKNT